MDLADSPEFNDCKHVARDNSTHTSLQGWIMDLGFVWDKFKSCEDCFAFMLCNSSDWKTNVCMKCVHWDVSNDSLGLMRYHPPQSYPRSNSCLDSDG
eukprot:3753258-Ditylum_brightwellii.AAC.1